MPATRSAAIAVALVGAVALTLQPASGAARFETLRGHTRAGASVAVTLRDGHLSRFTAGAATVRCADGWAVRSAASSARFGAGSVASGERHIAYPDGSPAALARVSVAATVRGRAVDGTVAYTLDLYGPGSRVNRCASGPVQFSAR